MAALDRFEIVCTTGKEGYERPVVCAKQIGKYMIEISWIDEGEDGPDATKAVWEVEVKECEPGGRASTKPVVTHVGMHAPDALRIAKGLVRFCQVLTMQSRADTDATGAGMGSDRV